MRIRLERIDSKDGRPTSELHTGEVVSHDVVVSVDNHPRRFTVYLRAKVLPGFDASVVYGDRPLEELFRFDSAALNALYAAVGKYRRGESPSMPIVLVDSDGAPDLQVPITPG